MAGNPQTHEEAQLSVNIPKPLKQRLAVSAKKEYRSMSQHVRYIIERYYKEVNK